MGKRTIAITRATAVIGATAALVVGVTFAALSTSATLTGNTLSSATAGLQISNGGSYGPTAIGFQVAGFVPGQGSGPLPFYLQNSGGTNLNLTVGSTTPLTSSGFSGWNNLVVTITNDATTVTTTTNMQALINGNVALPDALAAGATGNSAVPFTPGNYHITFDVNPSSITGSQVTVGSFDLTFTGTGATTP